jgi:Rrf2 family cysteine metabolism transcriptional repressor
MVVSQKTQYAVRAMIELAKQEGTGPVKAAKIASARFIPVRFLENILGELRQAGLVDSVRGKEGGYLLSRPARDLAVGEVIRVMQGPISAVDCAEAEGGRDCPLRSGCVLLPMWEKAHNAMMNVYDTTTLADLVEQELEAHECEALNYAI